jgi:hypothetical protein
MLATAEWCGVCLQDDLKVVSVKVVNGVPLCKGCDLTYSNEPEVLRDAREFLKSLDKPDKHDNHGGEVVWEPEEGSVPPPVTHLCICGCGTRVPDGERFAPGHDTAKQLPPAPERKRRYWPGDPQPEEKAAVVRVSNPETIFHPEPAPIRKDDGTVVRLNVKTWRVQKYLSSLPEPIVPADGLCQCGMPLRHSGRCQGTKVVREKLVVDEVPYGFCRCGCGGRTELARWSNATKGEVAGQPKQFLSGHNRRLLGHKIIESVCATCGEQFEVNAREGTDGKYCSQQCYKNRPRKPAKPARFPKPAKVWPKGICEKCGKEFEIRPNGGARFCSRACYEGRIVKQELAPVIPNQTPCACGCGEPVNGKTSRFVYGHGKRGWAKTDIVPAKAIPLHARTTVDRSITHREVITVEPAGAHPQGRKPVILVPGQKPTSQFQITPQIANMIWKGMTKEQRYDLLDCDSLWNEAYDDDMRCECMKNILLVYREQSAQ